MSRRFSTAYVTPILAGLLISRYEGLPGLSTEAPLYYYSFQPHERAAVARVGEILAAYLHDILPTVE